jgi:hypothetical protein
MLLRLLCLFASGEPGGNVGTPPASVLAVVLALAAIPVSVLGFHFLRAAIRLALRGELREIRRRLDETTAAVIDLKVGAYEQASGRG